VNDGASTSYSANAHDSAATRKPTTAEAALAAASEGLHQFQHFMKELLSFQQVSSLVDQVWKAESAQAIGTPGTMTAASFIHVAFHLYLILCKCFPKNKSACFNVVDIGAGWGRMLALWCSAGAGAAHGIEIEELGGHDMNAPVRTRRSEKKNGRPSGLYCNFRHMVNSLLDSNNADITTRLHLDFGTDAARLPADALDSCETFDDTPGKDFLVAFMFAFSLDPQDLKGIFNLLERSQSVKVIVVSAAAGHSSFSRLKMGDPKWTQEYLPSFTKVQESSHPLDVKMKQSGENKVFFFFVRRSALDLKRKR
jgi:hypothetical protein